MASRHRRRSRRSPRAPRSPSRSFLRRRSTLWLIAAVATLTVGIVLGVIAGAGDENGGDAGAPTPTLAVSLPDLAPEQARLQEAEVLDVIDGDTIEVRLDGRSDRVRYYGLDAPERGERCFGEAKQRNEALVGGEVLLLPDARERDRSGRLLRYVFTEDGVSIDARLIAEGLGGAWREDGGYRDELVALEAEARAVGVGCLWER